VFQRRALLIGAILSVALAACIPTPGTPATSTPVPATTVAPATSTTAPPTATVAPATATTAPATNTSAPATNTAAPATATATAGAGPTDLPPTDYLDDRSDAVAVLKSYVNALNRKEYARAYSYWEENSEVQPFPAFEAGYTNTQTIELTTGPLGGDAGAGNLYYTVAATLHATLADATQQLFVGCYTLHISQPAVQGTPPFRPLGIRSATVAPVAAGTDTNAAMATTCPETIAVTPQPTPPGGDISAAYYIDDRSEPVAVVRSLFNAINRHEYLRAYSYWETGSSVGDYGAYEAGYADTASVALTTGTATSDSGAGQTYYLVPVTLDVTPTSGSHKIYVGCYEMHLSNPGIQTEPPFMPMGVRAANVQLLPAGGDAAALMAHACDTPPTP